jgi:phosphoglycerate kinase
MQKEILFLGSLLTHPKKPFYAIIGGAKISTKMGVLRSLLTKVDAIFIGGGMSYTFFKSQGLNIGNSIHEDDQISAAKMFIAECNEKQIKCYLPKDLVVADALKADAHFKTIQINEGIPEGWQGVDIGSRTIQEWKSALQQAATVFWNGPLGVSEFSNFAKGTEEIARTLTDLHAITVVGGGDSVAAINRLGLGSKFTHISTGGGASMEFIEFGHLPGVDALSDRKLNLKSML